MTYYSILLLYHNAILCYSMLCFALLCCAMTCYHGLCYATLCRDTLCYAMQCYMLPTQCFAMPCYVISCIEGVEFSITTLWFMPFYLAISNVFLQKRCLSPSKKANFICRHNATLPDPLRASNSMPIMASERHFHVSV